MTDRNNNPNLIDANRPGDAAVVTVQAQNAPSGLRQLLPKAHPLSWWMLVITTLAILMNSIDSIILPTLLPAIMKEFNLTEVQAGWLNLLSFFGTLSGAVIFGIFSDYIGTGYKRCYSWSVAVLVEVIAGVATAFCKTLGVFQALRVAMGMGTGFGTYQRRIIGRVVAKRKPRVCHRGTSYRFPAGAIYRSGAHRRCSCVWHLAAGIFIHSVDRAEYRGDSILYWHP
ncbi:hypothetical protein SODG_003317 [Sodalis praecaptivus]|nr:hypothetical protein NVIRENTERO_04274 [Sodalis praecaptivus]